MRNRDDREWNRDEDDRGRMQRQQSNQQHDDRSYRDREVYEAQRRPGPGPYGPSYEYGHRLEEDRDQERRLAGRNRFGSGEDYGYGNVGSPHHYYAPRFGSFGDGGMRLDEGRYIAGDFGSTARYRPRMRTAPRGYQRSDERVREDICDRMCDRSDLDPRQLEVSVTNGEVTLTGSVPEREMKFRAEMICDSVAGVAEVHNQLRVRPDGGASEASRDYGSNAQPPSSGSSSRNASSSHRS